MVSIARIGGERKLAIIVNVVEGGGGKTALKNVAGGAVDGVDVV